MDKLLIIDGSITVLNEYINLKNVKRIPLFLNALSIYTKNVIFATGCTNHSTEPQPREIVFSKVA